MSAIQELSSAYDYNPDVHDYRAWWDHHRALIAAMEPAQWPEPWNASERAFTNDEVVEIREAYASGGVTLGDLVSLFGTNDNSISLMVRGITYADCGGPLTFRGQGNHPPKRQSA